MSGLELVDLSLELLLAEFVLSVVAAIILLVVLAVVHASNPSPSSSRPNDRQGWEYRLIDLMYAMLRWIEDRFGTGTAVAVNFLILTLLLFVMAVLVTVLMQIMLYPAL